MSGSGSQSYPLPKPKIKLGSKDTVKITKAANRALLQHTLPVSFRTGQVPVYQDAQDECCASLINLDTPLSYVYAEQTSFDASVNAPSLMPTVLTPAAQHAVSMTTSWHNRVESIGTDNSTAACPLLLHGPVTHSAASFSVAKFSL